MYNYFWSDWIYITVLLRKHLDYPKHLKQTALIICYTLPPILSPIKPVTLLWGWQRFSTWLTPFFLNSLSSCVRHLTSLFPSAAVCRVSGTGTLKCRSGPLHWWWTCGPSGGFKIQTVSKAKSTHACAPSGRILPGLGVVWSCKAGSPSAAVAGWAHE